MNVSCEDNDVGRGIGLRPAQIGRTVIPNVQVTEDAQAHV